jgi:hypothetical protein
VCVCVFSDSFGFLCVSLLCDRKYFVCVFVCVGCMTGRVL